MARPVNASFGRCESFWPPSSYSAVALASAADVVEKAAYVLANPVDAGLVRRGRDWPGLWSSPTRIGAAELEFKRPEHFFRSDGPMPPRASLALVPPPCFASAAEFRAELAAAVAEHELAAMARRGAASAGFLGVAGVLAQMPTSRPRSGEPRRALNPRVAARDRWKRVEVLYRLLEFLRAYRAAWRDWRAGVAGVLFPAGTYLVRVTHGVACAPG